MRSRIGVPSPTAFSFVLLLGLAACSGSAEETVPLPEKLRLPVFKAGKPNDKAKNFQVAITSTDSAGRSPGQSGYAGASSGGRCRVYLGDGMPVTSDELYHLGFQHLDEVVKDAGGVEAIMQDADLIPSAHIWADVNAPWRCVAGVVYNLKFAGYMTVGLMSSPTETGATNAASRAAYIDLPPLMPGQAPVLAKRTVSVAPAGEVSWNGKTIAPEKVAFQIMRDMNEAPDVQLAFVADAEVSYGYASAVLSSISASGVASFPSNLDFGDGENYCVFDTDTRKGQLRCVGSPGSQS